MFTHGGLNRRFLFSGTTLETNLQLNSHKPTTKFHQFFGILSERPACSCWFRHRPGLFSISQDKTIARRRHGQPYAVNFDTGTRLHLQRTEPVSDFSCLTHDALHISILARTSRNAGRKGHGNCHFFCLARGLDDNVLQSESKHETVITQ